MNCAQLIVLLLALSTLFISRSSSKTAADFDAEWEIIDENPNRKTVVEFTVALKTKNMDKLQQMVLERADPDSPLYSKWLDKKTILDLISPPDQVSTSIASWFEEVCSSGLKSIENRRDSLKISSTIACAEESLLIKLFAYKHKPSGYVTYRRDLFGSFPRLPQEFNEHIDFVSGLGQLPKVRKNKHSSIVNDAQTFAFNIPDTMRRVYQIPEGTKGTSSKNTQSVMEFLPVGSPYWTDVQTFSQQSGEVFNNVTRIIGPNDPGYADGESTLDVEYITTIGAGIDTWYITIGNGWIYEMANELFAMDPPPLVVSVSYGWPEEYNCESSVTNANCTGMTNKQYTMKSEDELSKVAALGVSVIVCSQDEGAPSSFNEFCSLDDSTPLFPIYPGTSAWATSVSSTTLVEPDSAEKPDSNPPICNEGYTCSTGTYEVATMANNTYYVWTTGGGFSNYTTVPSYQAAAVKNWLKTGSMVPPSWTFISGNRGYPDVSAIGDRILIYQYGGVQITAGTSASTPIFAAIVALLNDARLNAGKAPLGFLNPLLYKMPANNFHDITSGNNAWSRDGDAPCKYGYSADPGWDPVTGLGTPNYQNMLAYVMSLP
jgi:tripeptidyl-peptidase-1